MDVALEHRLADLETLLLLHLVCRWPLDSFCDSSIVRVRIDQCASLLRVSGEAVHRALRRLEGRRLLGLEKLRGRLHARLAIDLRVALLAPDCPAASLEDALRVALRARTSQGRDRVLLLELLSLAVPPDPVVRVGVRDLAARLGIARQSVTRIVSRLVRCGAVRRTADGIEVHALRGHGGAMSRQHAVSD